MLHSVVMFLSLLRLELISLPTVSANPIATHDDERLPRNTVGLLSGKVTLDCNRRNTAGVTWQYLKPGTNNSDVLPVPGKYKLHSSNYGAHQLVLESLHLDNAGTYICVSDADEIPNAGAYVIVVALGPVCMSNITTDELVEGDAIELTCAITYSAMPGVYLELRWFENGGTFEERKNFSAASSGLSFHSLTSVINAKSSALAPHTCQVTFHDIVGRGNDMAKNAPSFVNDASSSCIVRGRRAMVTGQSTTLLSSQQSTVATEISRADVSSWIGVTVAICIASVSGILSIVTLCHLYIKQMFVSCRRLFFPDDASATLVHVEIDLATCKPTKTDSGSEDQHQKAVQVQDADDAGANENALNGSGVNTDNNIAPCTQSIRPSEMFSNDNEENLPLPVQQAGNDDDTNKDIDDVEDLK